MAFWGAKLKPRKPFLIGGEQLDGRKLHITQATLGLHPELTESSERSIVKCRSGDEPAVFICSLKPGEQECIPLNLFFQEDVVFFVSGTTAVHLCGYWLEEDEDEDHDYSGDDEDYSGDEGFLVDDDEDDEEDESEDEMVRPSSVRIEEIKPEDEKQKELVVKPVEEENSEDEDGFPVKRKVDEDDEVPNKKSKTSGTPASAAAVAATPATEPQSGKKKKKKGKKDADAKRDGEAEQMTIDTPAAGNGTEPSEAKPAEKTSAKGKKKSAKKKFPNGLEIEDVKMGKPDGKQATPGKKVSIHYIGKLLKTGKIFDSTVGKKPFLFRLGVNEVVKGFDIGVAGMRIGDKRKVTIPPSMGYGEKSVGPIPPNSWLCFDIELVDVKK